MLSFFQPPDPPDEGRCLRCNRCITRDELLSDGCVECDDLLMDDMRVLWRGRPKDNGVLVRWYAFTFKQEWLGVRPGDTSLVIWIGHV